VKRSDGGEREKKGGPTLDRERIPIRIKREGIKPSDSIRLKLDESL